MSLSKIEKPSEIRHPSSTALVRQNVKVFVIARFMLYRFYYKKEVRRYDTGHAISKLQYF